MEEEYLVVFVTAPSEEVARQIAAQVVGEKLAACANILPAIQSLYWWEGKVQEDKEVLLIFKTQKLRMSGLETVVKQIHPYDVPEIIALPVAAGSQAYLDWIGASIRLAGE
ncbi:MAG TPA: divalent-cation tolerance protein CutA [Anaerolineales bacterium]|nr:divalent-cation tolerance protein CutA [Anaerolineales bacterium]